MAGFVLDRGVFYLIELKQDFNMGKLIQAIERGGFKARTIETDFCDDLAPRVIALIVNFGYYVTDGLKLNGLHTSSRISSSDLTHPALCPDTNREFFQGVLGLICLMPA